MLLFHQIQTLSSGAVPDTDLDKRHGAIPLAQGKAQATLSHPFLSQSQGHRGRLRVLISKRELRPKGTRLVGGRTGTETYACPSYHLSSTLQLPEGKGQLCSKGLSEVGQVLPPLEGTAAPALPEPFPPSRYHPVTSLSLCFCP